MLRYMLIAICLTVLAPAKAEVYRWVDQNGEVHFSDKAPENRDAETMDVPHPSPGPDTSSPASTRDINNDQMKAAQMLERARNARERSRAREQAKAREHEKYCQRLANEISNLKRYNRIGSEGEDGKIDYWSDEKADRYREQMRQKYRKDCG